MRDEQRGTSEMKVVFLEEAPGARIGDIREVKNGYARNYLLPRGMALPATITYIEKAQSRMRAEERRQASVDTQARELVEKFGDQPLVMHARVGETGRLYGSITAADIAEALSARAGHGVERRSIELGEPIRQVGEHTVHVRLTRNVSTDVTVKVEAQEEQSE
ncbi:MAG TPA: 50S ribosomal protein L9 [Dehalococcoidia bacterium]